jgi:hypothetical protein
VTPGRRLRNQAELGLHLIPGRKVQHLCNPSAATVQLDACHRGTKMAIVTKNPPAVGPFSPTWDSPSRWRSSVASKAVAVQESCPCGLGGRGSGASEGRNEAV